MYSHLQMASDSRGPRSDRPRDHRGGGEGRPGRGRARARLGPRLGRRDRARPGADGRARAARRGGRGRVRDGDVREGRVLGADPDLDVAVVGVDTGDAPAVAWEPGDAPRTGTPVFALANPGGRGLRTTFGLVSATGRGFRGPRGRRVAGSIEHTAPLPRGSSGGPLVDLAGNLSASTPSVATAASSSRCRPTPRCAAGSRSWRAARRPSGRGSASRSRRRGWRGDARRRRTRPSATACSCATWSTSSPAASAGLAARRPARPRRRDAADGHGRPVRCARRRGRHAGRRAACAGPRSARWTSTGRA